MIYLGSILELTFEERIIRGTYAGIFLCALIVFLIVKKSGLDEKMYRFFSVKFKSDAKELYGFWTTTEEYNEMLDNGAIELSDNRKIFLKGKPVGYNTSFRKKGQYIIYVEFNSK